MNQKNFETIDKSNLRKVILNFPKQFEIGLKIPHGLKVGTGFKNVIICGMGGSALAGGLIKLITDYYSSGLGHVPIIIHKSYDLPNSADNSSLIICVSYSGNTEETISSYTKATERDLKTVGIAAGGKLAELCQKNKTPFAKIPEAHIPPRQSVGYIFGILAKILAEAKIIPDFSEEMIAMANNLKPENIENQGKNLARKLIGKIPLVYASSSLHLLAQNWKIKFNENAKTPAFWNQFPELNHNEMAGFTKNQLLSENFYVIILKDKDEHPRISQDMDFFADLMKSKGIGVDLVEISGKNIFEKIFSTSILGDWTSYYLALESGIDPSPEEIIEEFKKKMAK